MKLNSITTKLVLLVTAAFIVTAVAVIVVAKRQTIKIIDVNANITYSEKVETIWRMLARSNNKLQQTGIADA